MLSVIIATLDSERALVRTLAALVPGSMAGLVREVIVADGGSRDETEAVADVAGCNFIRTEAPLARRLNSAAASARAPWLLFLQPGTVPEPAWIGEARHFTEHPPDGQHAAVFRPGPHAQPPLKAAVALLKAALGATAAARAGPADRPAVLRRARRAHGGGCRNGPAAPDRPAADCHAGMRRIDRAVKPRQSSPGPWPGANARRAAA